MRTTGGALAFENLTPPYEATLTKNLRRRRRDHHREDRHDASWPTASPARRRRCRPTTTRSAARATTRTIRARIRARRRSTAAPALQTGGSSSGIGTAANFWAGNVGTETSGSILSPSNQNMLAGDQADGRPHQPLRRDSDHRGSGHRRADGEERDATSRSCSARWRARRPIRTIRRRRLCTPPPGRDYTKFLNARRPQRRAHRHPARVVLRRVHAAGPPPPAADRGADAAAARRGSG